MPARTLINGDRVALEHALVKELFRPTAKRSLVEEALLQTLARRGSRLCHDTLYSHPNQALPRSHP